MTTGAVTLRSSHCLWGGSRVESQFVLEGDQLKGPGSTQQKGPRALSPFLERVWSKELGAQATLSEGRLAQVRNAWTGISLIRLFEKQYNKE